MNIFRLGISEECSMNLGCWVGEVGRRLALDNG